MRRDELEHIIRAATRIVEQDVVVIGSQAVLASHPTPPERLAVSIEADVYPAEEPGRARELNVIGEESLFHDTYGYYADPVGPETPKAPAGWQDRLIPIRNENTEERAGWCMEAHDIVLSKCVAGREKDWAYALVAITHEIVNLHTLLERSRTLPLPQSARREIRRHLQHLSNPDTDGCG